MDVLDRFRAIQEGCLEGPSFIAGPCGVVPETQVHLSAQVHTAAGADSPGITVIIRPYQPSPDGLSYLECTLKNDAGALVRFMESVSSLDINIVNSVSSIMPDLGQQQVCMVLDWSASNYRDRTPSTAEDRRKYRDFHSVFPIGFDRNVKLYETIDKACRDVIVRRAMGHDLPMLRLQEFADPSGLVHFGTAVVSRSKKAPETPAKHANARIELPDSLRARLRLSLNVNSDEGLHYVLTADVKTRTLRAFFPEAKSGPYLHLGFFHLDAPGTFAAILRPFDQYGIKVVNCLVRAEGHGKNVLEALLELGDAAPKDLLKRVRDNVLDPTEDLCRWAGKWMAEHATEENERTLRRCGLEIGPPLYPRSARRPVKRIPIADILATVKPGSKCGESVVRKPAESPAKKPELKKAEFVREYVRRNQAIGVTAGELKEAFGDAEIPISAQYLYSLLHRLAADNGVLQHVEGRYYPTDKSLVGVG